MSLETPLEHAHIDVKREGFRGVFHSDLLLGSEDFLVDIWMGLDLHTTVVVLELKWTKFQVGSSRILIVSHYLYTHAAESLVRDKKGQQTVDLHVVKASISATGQTKLLFHS